MTAQHPHTGRVVTIGLWLIMLLGLSMLALMLVIMVVTAG